MSRQKETGAESGPGRSADTPDANARYQAFLSYSHSDTAHADWLHKALERFAVPKGLIGRITPNGAVPNRLTPIFRDRHELAASSDLGQTIRAALKQSRFLIVLCSPAAAASRWVNEEILAFKKLHGDRRVLAAIVAGEPWASELPGREAEECFPPALREKYDRRGRATGKRAEPIAADLREERDGREAGKLKLIAGMLGLGLDDLVRREQQRRQKRLTYIAAASLAGMALTSGLAVFAFDKRDEARDQRREAEGLVGFMLGDLREKLEPIGRLDALDAVGSRALEYFEKQDKSELSDEALAQRSRALTLLGELAQTRGDLDGALARYAEAMAGTGEMVRRTPTDPQRLYDHAQNVFWVGEIGRERGRLDQAEAAAREYRNLAYRMKAIDPSNVRWRMETQYADANLGIVYLARRRFAEASRQFQTALATIERIAAAQPNNRDYQQNFSTTLAWLADAQRAEGRLAEAIAQRQRQLVLLERLSDRGRDVAYRQQKIVAEQALGRLFASRGDAAAAIAHLGAAVAEAEALISIEPDNMRWVEFAASSKLALAKAKMMFGRSDEASAQARSGCDLAERLLTRDRGSAGWRDTHRDCLAVRAELALAAGADAEAAVLADRLLRSAQLETQLGMDGLYKVAAAKRLVGDVARSKGDLRAATIAWQSALNTLPQNVAETPSELSERASLLRRLNRIPEARVIESKILAAGFHHSI